MPPQTGGVERGEPTRPGKRRCTPVSTARVVGVLTFSVTTVVAALEHEVERPAQHPNAAFHIGGGCWWTEPLRAGEVGAAD